MYVFGRRVPGYLLLVLGPILAIAVAAVILILGGNKQQTSDTGSSTKTPVAAPSTPAPTEPSQSGAPDPASLTQSREALNKQVAAFVRVYFSRDPRVSPDRVKQAVSPFVTTHFLETAMFGFGDSASDQAMTREGSRLQEVAVTSFQGEFLDDNTASGAVTVEVTKYYQDGTTETPFRRPQELTLIKQDGIWRIDSAPRT